MRSIIQRVPTRRRSCSHIRRRCRTCTYPRQSPQVPTLPVLPAFLHAPLASPELAAAILDALADAVVVYDAAGRIAGTNAAAVRLFGPALPGRQTALAGPIAEREAAVDLRTLDGRPLERDEWPALRVLRGEVLFIG